MRAVLRGHVWCGAEQKRWQTERGGRGFGVAIVFRVAVQRESECFKGTLKANYHEVLSQWTLGDALFEDGDHLCPHLRPTLFKALHTPDPKKTWEENASKASHYPVLSQNRKKLGWGKVADSARIAQDA